MTINKTGKGIVLALLAFLTTASVNAHHSSAPHFDANSPVTVEGVITEFKFVNPHAYLYIDVTNSDGTVTNWNCEMSAASALKRNGWSKELFGPGKKIKIDGIAARRDPHGCSFQAGELEGGFTITRNGPIERSEAPEHVAETDAYGGDTMSFAGNWQTQPRRRGGGRPGGGGGPPRMDRFTNILTDAGKEAAASYDERFDDPALECSPSSIIRAWGEPNGVSQIELHDDRAIIRHEFMDTVRTVYLDDRRMPDDFERGLTGFSVGNIDGNAMTIETTGFAAGVLLPHPGVMHTEDMRVVETLTLSDDGQQVVREYEVLDPQFLKEPYTGRSVWLRSDLPLTAYDCEELSGVSKIRPGQNE
ncbi:MAG: DUF6152 family protein [Woeseiaceae bacterium]